MIEATAFMRTLNGHEQEIMTYTEMGGGTEAVAIWCHTCDPEGKDSEEFDVRGIGMREALNMAIEASDMHAATQVEFPI